jgi:formylglycine-generating enzyme required for sulfatase activity
LDLAVKIEKIAAVLIAVALMASVARNAGAQTPDAEQAAQDLHDAEAVSKRHSAELMKIPHVTVVTGEVDAGNEAAILVEVDEQKNVDAVTRQLPSQIEGFPVEVDEERNFRSEAGHWGNESEAEDGSPRATSLPTPKVSP